MLSHRSICRGFQFGTSRRDPYPQPISTGLLEDRDGDLDGIKRLTNVSNAHFIAVGGV